MNSSIAQNVSMHPSIGISPNATTSYSIRMRPLMSYNCNVKVNSNNTSINTTLKSNININKKAIYQGKAYTNMNIRHNICPISTTTKRRPWLTTSPSTTHTDTNTISYPCQHPS